MHTTDPNGLPIAHDDSIDPNEPSVTDTPNPTQPSVAPAPTDVPADPAFTGISALERAITRANIAVARHSQRVQRDRLLFQEALQQQSDIRKKQEELGLLGDLGTGSDTVRTFVGSLATFPAQTADALSRAADFVQGKNPDGTKKGLADALSLRAEEFLKFKEDVLGSRNRETQGIIANSRITGDITDPSSIDFGKDPSLFGIGLQLLESLGDQGPLLAGYFARTNPAILVTLGVLGAVQAGSSQAREAEQRLEQLTNEQLAKESTEFARLVEEQNIDPKVARRLVTDAAGDAAFLAAAPVGTVSSVATKILLDKVPALLGVTKAKQALLAQKLEGAAKTAEGVAGGATGKALGSAVRGNLAAQAKASPTSLKSIGAKTLGTGAASFFEEGTSEVLETVAGRAAANLATGTKTDLTKDTAADFFLGGLVGGTIGTVGGVKQAVQQGKKDSAKKLLSNVKGAINLQQKIDKAAETGDFSVFVDKNGVVDTGAKANALLIRANNPELSEEERKTAQEEYLKTKKELETEVTEFREIRDRFGEDGIASIEKEIQQVKDKIAKGDQPEKDEARLSLIKELEGALEARKKASPDELKKAFENNDLIVKRKEKELESLLAEERRFSVSKEQVAKLNQLKAEAGLDETVTDIDPEKKVTAAKELVKTLASGRPDILSPEQIKKLAEDETNGLTKLEREYLRKLASTETAMADVTTGIIKGTSSNGKRFVGIGERRRNIGSAISTNNKDRARAELKALRILRKDHKNKQAALKKAIDIAKKNKKKVYVSRVKGSKTEWQITNRKPKADKARQSGILVVNPDELIAANNLLDSIEKESEVLEKANEEFTTLLISVFGSKDSATAATDQAETGPTKEAKTAEKAPESASKATKASEGTDTSETPKEAEKGQNKAQAKKQPSIASVILGAGKSKFTQKDARKASTATRFIGFGANGSSTDRYRKALEAQLPNVADTEKPYSPEDRVFVSINGQRQGRIPLLDSAGNLTEKYKPLQKAVDAGATILADTPTDRKRKFNVGERELAAWLQSQGYTEAEPGVWKPKTQPEAKTKPEATAQPEPKPKPEAKAEVEDVSEASKETKDKKEEIKSFVAVLDAAFKSGSKTQQAARLEKGKEVTLGLIKQLSAPFKKQDNYQEPTITFDEDNNVSVASYNVETNTITLSARVVSALAHTTNKEATALAAEIIVHEFSRALVTQTLGAEFVKTGKVSSDPKVAKIQQAIKDDYVKAIKEAKNKDPLVSQARFFRKFALYELGKFARSTFNAAKAGNKSAVARLKKQQTILEWVTNLTARALLRDLQANVSKDELNNLSKPTRGIIVKLTNRIKKAYSEFIKWFNKTYGNDSEFVPPSIEALLNDLTIQTSLLFSESTEESTSDNTTETVDTSPVDSSTTTNTKQEEKKPENVSKVSEPFNPYSLIQILFDLSISVSDNVKATRLEAGKETASAVITYLNSLFKNNRRFKEPNFVIDDQVDDEIASYDPKNNTIAVAPEVISALRYWRLRGIHEDPKNEEVMAAIEAIMYEYSRALAIQILGKQYLETGKLSSNPKLAKLQKAIKDDYDKVIANKGTGNPTADLIIFFKKYTLPTLSQNTSYYEGISEEYISKETLERIKAQKTFQEWTYALIARTLLNDILPNFNEEELNKLSEVAQTNIRKLINQFAITNPKAIEAFNELSENKESFIPSSIKTLVNDLLNQSLADVDIDIGEDADVPELTQEESDQLAKAEEVPNETTEEVNLDAADPNADKAVDDVVEEVKEPEGILPVFSKKQQPITRRETLLNFRNTNLVAKFATQNVKKTLVKVKDFITKLSNNPYLVVTANLVSKRKLAGVTKKGTPTLTRRQLNAVTNLVNVVKEFNKVLKEKYFVENPVEEFSSANLLDQLRDFKQPEENLVSALSYAAYEFLRESGSSRGFHDSKTVSRMLGFDTKHRPDPEAVKLLHNVGQSRKVIINELGRIAINALGVKFKKNSYGNLEKLLTQALGTLTFEFLKNEGYLVETKITEEQIASFLPNNRTYKPHEWVFYNIKRNEEGEALDLAKEIAEANEGTQSIVSAIFDVESKDVQPSLKPFKLVKGKVVPINKFVRVPFIQLELQNERDNLPYTIRPDAIVDIFNELDDDIAEHIVGIRERDDKTTQVINRIRYASQNETLRKDLKHWKDFFANPDFKDKPFYLRGIIWVNQRVGLINSALNPQTNKVVRFLVGQKRWQGTVKLVDDTDNTFGDFAYAVGLGLDLPVDNQDLPKSIKEVRERLSESDMVPAIEALRARLKGKPLTREQQLIIRDVVASTDTNLHALDALIAWANYLNAKEAGQESFVTNIFLEVDGVANGPSLTQIVLGATQKTLDKVLPMSFVLNKAGFYSKKDGPFRNFGQYKEAGNKDFYEETLTDVTELLAETVKNNKKLQPKLKAVAAILGRDGLAKEIALLINRSDIKSVLTPINFGSSVNKGLEAFSKEFVIAVATKIEEALQSDDPQNAVDDVFNALKPLLPKVLLDKIRKNIRPLKDENGKPLKDHKGKPILGVSIEYARDEFLNSKFEREVLARAFLDVLNAPIEKGKPGIFASAINNRFEELFKKRGLIVNFSNAAYSIFLPIYKKEREKYIRELQKKGIIPASINDQKGSLVTKVVLNEEQEAELLKRVTKIVPRVHTYLSKLDGDIEAGLLVAKNKETSSNTATSPELKQEIAYPSPDNETEVSDDLTEEQRKENKEIKGGLTKVTSFAPTSTLTAPGVATVAAMVHSMDSAISTLASKGLGVLNLHDAFGLGISEARKAAKALNKVTYEAVTNYFVPLEVVSMFDNFIENILESEADLLRDPEVRNEIIEAFKDIIYGSESFTNPDTGKVDAGLLLDAYYEFRKEAYLSAINSLEALIDTDYVSQYSYPGGEYEVTEEDRNKAKAKLAEITAEYKAFLKNIKKTGEKRDKGLRNVEKFIQLVNKAPVLETNLEREYVDAVNEAKPSDVITAVSSLIAKNISEGTKQGRTFLDKAKRKVVNQLTELVEKIKKTQDVNAAIDEVIEEDYRDKLRELISRELIQGSYERLRSHNVPYNDLTTVIDEVIKDLDSADSTLAPEIKEDLKNLNQALLRNPPSLRYALDHITLLTNEETITELLDSYLLAPHRKTVWGDLGDSPHTHLATLVKKLREKPSMSGKETIEVLENVIKSELNKLRVKAGPVNRRNPINVKRRQVLWSQLKYLQKLREAIPDDITVEYLTATSENTLNTDAQSNQNSEGWYDPILRRVYIKGTDFSTSRVTPELLLHELLHATLFTVIDNPRKFKNAKAFINDLENLRLAAIKFVEDGNNGLTEYEREKFGKDFALKNVHELISWGLTDIDFQQRVLKKVKIQPKANTKIIDGLTTFLNFIKKVLGIKDQAETGFDVVISHSMALATIAKENRAKLVKVAKDINDNNPTLASKHPEAEAASMTNEEVFDLLESPTRPVSREHAVHLKNLLKDIVDRIHGPDESLAKEFRKDAAYNPNERLAQLLLEKESVFSSKALGALLDLREQEAFVLEQLEQVINEAIKSEGKDGATFFALLKVFRETKEKLSPADFYDGDFSTATQEEKELAIKKYNFIFRPGSSKTSKADEFLARFMALALAYEPLRGKLDFEMSIPNSRFRDKNVRKIINSIWKWILQFFNNVLRLEISGDTAQERLDRLIKRLVNTEIAYRQKVIAQETEKKVLNDAFNKADETLTSAVEKLDQSALVNADNPISKGAKLVTTTAKVLAKDQLDEVFRAGLLVRNRFFKDKKFGFAADIANELLNEGKPDIIHRKLFRAAKVLEQERHKNKVLYAQTVLNSFDPNNLLTDDVKKSLTRVLLDLDIASLYEDEESPNSLTIERLTEIMEDDAALNRAIDRFENKIKKLAKKDTRRILITAHNLGYYLTKGGEGSADLVPNADLIVDPPKRPAFTKELNKNYSDVENIPEYPESTREELVNLTDKLVSLYSLRHVNKKHRENTAKVMRHELERPAVNGVKENGVLSTLRLMKNLKAEALDKNFGKQRKLMRKGYTKDLLASNVQIDVAPIDFVEEMEKHGWVRVGKVPEDPHLDRGDVRVLMMLKVPLINRVTGTASFTNMDAAGKKVFGATENGKSEEEVLYEKRMPEIKRLHSMDPKTYDPRKTKWNYAIPLVTNKGVVTSYRYMMDNKTKEEIFEQDLRFENVIGNTASHLLDKYQSRQNNRQLMDALLEDYRTNGGRNPEAYIELSLKVNDPELVELWKLLPDDIRAYVRHTWGSSAIFVRKEILKMHFGYKKLSLLTPFESDPFERNLAKTVTVNVLEQLLGKRARVRIAKVDDALLEITRWVRDTWVIRNFKTFLGNTESNITELLAFGVSFKDITKYAAEATQGIFQYDKDKHELDRLKLMLITHPEQKSRELVEDRILELEFSLSHNPVRPLVEAGLSQTIVEDIETELDPFRTKSHFAKQVEDQFNRIPEPLLGMGKTMLMTHDTELYKVMFTATIRSDFIARYVLYKHFKNQKDNKMTEDEIIQRVSDAFVNYDEATNRWLQALNDYNIVPFTKYYLRIQKILFWLYRYRPGRMMSLAVVNHYLDNITTINDSFISHKLEHLTAAGPFEVLGAVTEPVTFAPFKFIASLFE